MERVSYNNISYLRLRIVLENKKVYEGLFTAYRVDRKSVPDELYQYEIRHADDDGMEPASISECIWVNHFGTFICNRKLDIRRETEIIEYEFINEL